MTFPFEPPDRYDNQETMYNIIGFPVGHRFLDHRADHTTEFQVYWDPIVHKAFYDYWYNDEITPEERAIAEETLITELRLVYNLDVMDLWDWDEFRAWYDLNAA